MDNNIFYTYIYLDPRQTKKYVYGKYQFDHRPFYVGKGKGETWLTHLKEATGTKLAEDCDNPHKVNEIRKIQMSGKEPIIIKIKEYLLEQEAWDLEFDLIEVIGRLKFRNGPLTNFLPGGEGGDTMSGKTKENDPGRARQAAKMKIIMRGRKRGTKETTPWIARQAEKMRGRQNAAKSFKIIWPDGKETIIKNLSKFYRENALNASRAFTALYNHKPYKGFIVTRE